MIVYVAHLARDTNPDETACGEPWQAWQEPMPTNAEVGADALSYGARVALRQSDEARALPRGAMVRQCQACLRVGQQEAALQQLAAIAVWAKFREACGTVGHAVRVLKGEAPAPAGWEDFVAGRRAAREADA